MSNSGLVDYVRISPNRNSPRNHVIDTITIHCVVGQLSVERLGEMFAETSRKASSNYGIGSDGRIGMYCEEKDRSWCSSNRSNDNRAVTIEVASDTTHPYAVNDKVYESLINLVTDICKRNNIKELKWKADKTLVGQVDKQNMTVHRWFANKACPGDYLYSRHADIAAKVNAKLSAPVKEVDKKDDGVFYRVQLGAFSKAANAENLRVKVVAAGFEAFVTKVDKYYKVQVGAFNSITNAENLKNKIEKAGFEAIISTQAEDVTEEKEPNDNETIIWDFFKSKGLNDYAVAGIWGNLDCESNHKPNNLQQSYEARLGHTDESYTEAVDNGTYDNFVRDKAGYGLAQWTYWSRKQNLLNYAKARGKSIGDLQMQLDFMWEEIQAYKDVMEVLWNAKSVEEASDIVMVRYEAPANKTEENQNRRAAVAQAGYDMFVKRTIETPKVEKEEPTFKAYTVQVTASALNVRDGAGTKYKVNDIIRDRGVYTIIEESDNGWGKLKSGAGWISLKYTKRV